MTPLAEHVATRKREFFVEYVGAGYRVISICGGWGVFVFCAGWELEVMSFGVWGDRTWAFDTSPLMRVAELECPGCTARVVAALEVLVRTGGGRVSRSFATELRRHVSQLPESPEKRRMAEATERWL